MKCSGIEIADLIVWCDLMCANMSTKHIDRHESCCKYSSKVQSVHAHMLFSVLCCAVLCCAVLCCAVLPLPFLCLLYRFEVQDLKCSQALSALKPHALFCILDECETFGATSLE